MPESNKISKDERSFMDCIAMSLLVSGGDTPNLYDKAYEYLMERRAFFLKHGWEIP